MSKTSCFRRRTLIKLRVSFQTALKIKSQEEGLHIEQQCYYISHHCHNKHAFCIIQLSGKLNKLQSTSDFRRIRLHIAFSCKHKMCPNICTVFPIPINSISIENMHLFSVRKSYFDWDRHSYDYQLLFISVLLI